MISDLEYYYYYYHYYYCCCYYYHYGHRNIGTHISKPLSLKLDHWTAEQTEQMLAGCNAAATC